MCLDNKYMCVCNILYTNRYARRIHCGERGVVGDG